MLLSLAPAVKLLKEPTAVECEIDIPIPLPQTAGTLKLELKLKVGSSLAKLKTLLGFNFVDDVLEASDSCTNDPLEVESLDDIREQLEANVELETKLCVSGACRGCALGRGNLKLRGLHEEMAACNTLADKSCLLVCTGGEAVRGALLTLSKIWSRYKKILPFEESLCFVGAKFDVKWLQVSGCNWLQRATVSIQEQPFTCSAWLH